MCVVHTPQQKKKRKEKKNIHRYQQSHSDFGKMPAIHVCVPRIVRVLVIYINCIYVCTIKYRRRNDLTILLCDM